MIRISSKFVPKDQFDNKTALVHVMAWRRIGDKPLPELMLKKFTGAYIGTNDVSIEFEIRSKLGAL